MRCEIVAVGTELLLGQIVDTNSSWMGEQLAIIGDRAPAPDEGGRQPRPHRRRHHGGARPRRRGDRVRRARPDPGRHHPRGHRPGDGRRARARRRGRPTSSASSSRRAGRAMPDNNLRQADVPVGATVIEQRTGTAPGLICPVGDERRLRGARRAVRDEGDARAGGAARPGGARRRAAGHRQPGAAHVGRERVARRRAARPAAARCSTRPATPRSPSSPAASRASRCASRPAATARSTSTALLDAEEAEVRAVLGDIVFSGDDLPMEAEVGRLLVAQGRTLADRRVAHRRPGGFARRRTSPARATGSGRRGRLRQPGEVRRPRRAGGPGRQRGGRQGDGRRRPPGPRGRRRRLRPPAWPAPPSRRASRPAPCGSGSRWATTSKRGSLRLPGDRDRVRQLSVISLMDLLRRRLLA